MEDFLYKLKSKHFTFEQIMRGEPFVEENGRETVYEKGKEIGSIVTFSSPTTYIASRIIPSPAHIYEDVTGFFKTRAEAINFIKDVRP